MEENWVTQGNVGNPSLRLTCSWGLKRLICSLCASEIIYSELFYQLIANKWLEYFPFSWGNAFHFRCLFSSPPLHQIAFIIILLHLFCSLYSLFNFLSQQFCWMNIFFLLLKSIYTICWQTILTKMYV